MILSLSGNRSGSPSLRASWVIKQGLHITTTDFLLASILTLWKAGGGGQKSQSCYYGILQQSEIQSVADCPDCDHMAMGCCDDQYFENWVANTTHSVPSQIWMVVEWIFIKQGPPVCKFALYAQALKWGKQMINFLEWFECFFPDFHLNSFKWLFIHTIHN